MRGDEGLVVDRPDDVAAQVGVGPEVPLPVEGHVAEGLELNVRERNTGWPGLIDDQVGQPVNGKRQEQQQQAPPVEAGCPCHAAHTRSPRRRMNSSPFANWSRVRNSSGLCACSILPGPQTTVGIAAISWNSPASVP